MKKLALASFTLVAALTACKKKADETKTTDKPAAPATGAPAADKPAADKPATPPPAEVKLAPLDLSAVGEDWAGYTVMAPEGATVKESFGAAEIVAGAAFNLDIRTGKGDVAAFKKEVEANDMNKVKRFVVDSPEAILYESEVMGQNEFHFYGNVKVGDKELNCEDVKGPRHMQADAEAMWKACQSLAKK